MTNLRSTLRPFIAILGCPPPLRAPLDEQQGILLDSKSGTILIRADDSTARQRFTEGHELMELLFDAQEPTGFCLSTANLNGASNVRNAYVIKGRQSC
ncbi:MAG: hypothetical protein HC936_02155 [Leptolyngbyaceae cyanobacterium SU_3_3]|nr:hypothetical protein [Leptolyngbyaceae cyanobacterium SU_3_3]